MNLSSPFLYFFAAMLSTNWRASFLGGALGEKMRFSDFAFLLFFLTWLIEKFKNRRPFVPPPLFRQVLLLPLAAIVSYLASRHSPESTTQCAGMIYLTLIYLVTADAIRTREQAEKIFRFWVIVCALTSAATLIALIFGISGIGSEFVGMPAPGHLTTLIPFPRAEGLAYDTNAFAFYLHAALILALAYWLKKPNQKGSDPFLLLKGVRPPQIFFRALPAAMGVMIAAIFFTTSRLILGTLAGVWFLLKVKDAQHKFSWLRKACAAAFALLFPLTLWVTVQVVTPIKFRPFQAEWNHALNHYFLTAREGYKMFAAHPLFGIGIGNFRTEFKKRIRPEDLDPHQIYFTLEQFEREGVTSHHLYSGWIAQTGGLGLAAFVFFFGGYYLKIFRGLRHQNNLISFGMAAVLLGFVIQGLFDDFITERFFWFFLALATTKTALPKIPA